MALLPFLLTLAAAQVTAPQAPAARADSAARRPDSLEALVVRAVRAPGAPIAESTLRRDELRRRSAGQDLPLLVQQAPGVTVTNDAGGFANYSYLRVRGVDQTRLNLTLDGVPLNDPEDQVFYFTNFADLAGALGSVQVQRGVGTSTFGTASFGGSINLESAPLGGGDRGGTATLGGGAFGTRRAALEYATGMRGRWAAVARAAGHETDGYREHSGNQARSAFGSVGWFGDRDLVKASWLVGRSRNQSAYLAASADDLRANPRANPMSPLERDDFAQQIGRLEWTRALGEGQSATLVGFHNQAQGEYDVLVGGAPWNFTLRHQWTGAIATWAVERGRWRMDAGAMASRYWRDHGLRIRPDLATDVYLNTGHKAEQSAFVKLARGGGPLRLFGDLQLRRAAFRYEPTAGAGFVGPRVAWAFANPKIGATWAITPTATARLSAGRNWREPTRTDLFAGADDLDRTQLEAIGALAGVRPERVDDLEAGLAWQRGAVRLDVTAFAMRFRDEIAAIGRLTPLGSQLRQNVDRSRRDGVELHGSWQPSPRVELRLNGALQRSRIAAYRDAESGVTYRDVVPLLTPARTANAEMVLRPGRTLSLALRGRHVGESHLANDGDRRFMAPAFSVADLGVDWTIGRTTVAVQWNNLADATIYAAGYHDGTTAYYYPMARRHLFATLRVAF